MIGYLTGLPAFLSYFVSGLGCYAAFAVIYTRMTPQKETGLIREGNLAAVVAFSGRLAWLQLSARFAAAHSVSLVDFLLWAVIGIAIQVLAFYIANFTMKDLHGKITEGNVAAGLWGGGIAVAIGILNAACMTY